MPIQAMPRTWRSSAGMGRSRTPNDRAAKWSLHCPECGSHTQVNAAVGGGLQGDARRPQRWYRPPDDLRMPRVDCRPVFPRLDQGRLLGAPPRWGCKPSLLDLLHGDGRRPTGRFFHVRETSSGRRQVGPDQVHRRPIRELSSVKPLTPTNAPRSSPQPPRSQPWRRHDGNNAPGTKGTEARSDLLGEGTGDSVPKLQPPPLTMEQAATRKTPASFSAVDELGRRWLSLHRLGIRPTALTGTFVTAAPMAMCARLAPPECRAAHGRRWVIANERYFRKFLQQRHPTFCDKHADVRTAAVPTARVRSGRSCPELSSRTFRPCCP